MHIIFEIGLNTKKLSCIFKFDTNYFIFYFYLLFQLNEQVSFSILKLQGNLLDKLKQRPLSFNLLVT